MPRQTGARTKIAIKKQTDVATIATGNYTQIPYYSTSFGAEQELDAVPMLGVGGTNNPRDPGQPQIGSIDVSGDYVVPIDKEFLGYWLQMMFGNPSTTGTTNYVHTFKSGGPGTNQLFFSGEHQFADASTYALFQSIMANSMSIEWQSTGLAQATFSCVGIKETRSGSSGAGTLTAPTVVPFTQFQGTVKRGGSALANCVGASFTLTNNLDVVRAVSGTYGAGNIEGADWANVSARGTLRVRYADDALITAAINQTSAAIELAFTKDANTALIVTINNAVLSRPKTAVQGPGGIELSVDFEGFGTGTEMVTTVLKNQTATY